MCIVSAATTVHVSATQIAFIPLQYMMFLVIYQNIMSFKNGEYVTMILPVPTSESITLVDLYSYPSLFNDLAAGFDRDPFHLSRQYLSFSSTPPHPQPLPIQSVGQYEVSVASTLDVLQHGLDWDHFKLTTDVMDILRTHYPVGFSFVVARQKNGVGNPHALGYIYKGYTDHSVFVPTRHGGHDESDGAHWDHEIYLFGVKESSVLNAVKPLSSERTSVERMMVPWLTNGLRLERITSAIPHFYSVPYPWYASLTRIVIAQKSMFNKDLEMELSPYSTYLYVYGVLFLFIVWILSRTFNLAK